MLARTQAPPRLQIPKNKKEDEAIFCLRKCVAVATVQRYFSLRQGLKELENRLAPLIGAWRRHIPRRDSSSARREGGGGKGSGTGNAAA